MVVCAGLLLVLFFFVKSIGSVRSVGCQDGRSYLVPGWRQGAGPRCSADLWQAEAPDYVVPSHGGESENGMLSIERFSMLGDSISAVKATLKAIVGDVSKFGADLAAQELSLTLLAAVWKSASALQEHVSAWRAKMEEDPSKIPEIPGQDHAEFREIFVNNSTPNLHARAAQKVRRARPQRLHGAWCGRVSTRSRRCARGRTELFRRLASVKLRMISFELSSTTTRSL